MEDAKGTSPAEAKFIKKKSVKEQPKLGEIKEVQSNNSRNKEINKDIPPLDTDKLLSSRIG